MFSWYITDSDNWTVLTLNPSFTKPFGTHTFYQGERGRSDPPAISKTAAPVNVKFCMVLEAPYKC